MKLAEEQQHFDAFEIEGFQLSKSDLISLLDDFTHDIRNPLTVISEFASMLSEGVFEDDEGRETATRFISEKTAATFLLVDVLDLLVRSAYDCVDVHKKACNESHILHSAILQLDQFNSPGRGSVRFPEDELERRVWCDPTLATRSLVYIWSWMRHTAEREVEIDLEILPVPSRDGVLFPAVRHDCQIDHDSIKQMTSLHAEENDKNLTLRAASESARLAGGEVFVIGQEQGLALFLPSADENCG